jgi:hypothetical protein
VKRGPKGKSPEQQIASGQRQPCRQVVTLFADHASRPDPDVIEPPSGMTPAARTIWRTKTDRYRQRGQKISGFEDALRQMCELEAMLNKGWQTGHVTMAMVNAHRILCAEFFDTPASQRVPASSVKDQNRFAVNGPKVASA